MWYKNVDTRFFRCVTMHAFDRQTDEQTDRQTDRQTDWTSFAILCVALHAVARGKSRVTCTTVFTLGLDLGSDQNLNLETLYACTSAPY